MKSKQMLQSVDPKNCMFVTFLPEGWKIYINAGRIVPPGNLMSRQLPQSKSLCEILESPLLPYTMSFSRMGLHIFEILTNLTKLVVVSEFDINRFRTIPKAYRVEEDSHFIPFDKFTRAEILSSTPYVVSIPMQVYPEVEHPEFDHWQGVQYSPWHIEVSKDFIDKVIQEYNIPVSDKESEWHPPFENTRAFKRYKHVPLTKEGTWFYPVGQLTNYYPSHVKGCVDEMCWYMTPNEATGMPLQPVLKMIPAEYVAIFVEAITRAVERGKFLEEREERETLPAIRLNLLRHIRQQLSEAWVWKQSMPVMRFVEY